jgi:ubiquinone/menaquinone biosynthesis C-methylase UbiE
LSINEVAARGFSSAADVYERVRPGYAPEAVAWLGERLGISPGRTVLDLGAGTGKLTRDLVPTGAQIVAVEPLEEMRAHLLEAVPGVEALEATAEAIPLADESVDAVVCAQAFHWFRPAALPEIHRVLRPEGALALIWNSRDLSDPIQKELDQLLDPVRPADQQIRGEHSGEKLAASPLFGPVEHRTWPSEQRVTRDELVDLISSRSYVASMPASARAELLDTIRSSFPAESEPIVVRYVVDVFVADRA